MNMVAGGFIASLVGGAGRPGDRRIFDRPVVSLTKIYRKFTVTEKDGNASMALKFLGRIPGAGVVFAAIVLTVASLAAAEEPGDLAISDLPRLAEQGKFASVLTVLRDNDSLSHDLRAAALIRQLQRFQENEVRQSASRQEEFRIALQEVDRLREQSQIGEALVRAIDAVALVQDPHELVAEPRVQAVVDRAKIAALEAEKSGNWAEATDYYRLLDMLYDDFSTFHDQAREAARHVRVLRLYAAEQLEKWLAARNPQGPDGKSPPLKIGDSHWRQKLEGIDLSMFRQAIAQAARRHVTNAGYVPLLRGAVKGLLTLAQTQGLEEAFPLFADPDRVDLFKADLLHLLDKLNRRQESMNFLDAASVFDRIVAINGRTVKIPEEVLVYELTEGAIHELDEFSSVIWPSEKRNFRRNTQGRFSGVGISIAIVDNRLAVMSPLEDSPAYVAGIRAGDIIISVDGQDVSTWTLEQAVDQITGPEGSIVILGIERPGSDKPLEFKLNRAEITIHSVMGWSRKPTGGWDYFVDRENRIGYIRLSQFIPQSAPDLDEAISQMETEGGFDALILDLRFNPGGLLSSAVEIVDRFVRHGLIVSTVGQDGKPTSQYMARPEHTYPDFPMAVLINEGSASASEIVAGSLQDYGRAVIIGSRSYGKGSVQDLFHLDQGEAYLKLTTQYYKLPKGRIIHRIPDALQWGIEPDLLVRMTSQQVADALDLRQKADVLQTEAPANPAPVQEDPRQLAQQILDKSADPQLEGALLVLNTRLLANQLTLAQRN